MSCNHSSLSRESSGLISGIQADDAVWISPCCAMPEYKRANMMVCNVYNALECVGCINNTVARLLLALTEMQRDPTDSTSSSVSHNHRCDESLGLRIQIRSQVCLTHIPLPEPGENTVQQLLLVLDRSSVYTPRRPELLEKQAKKYKATDYLYPFQAVRSFIPSWVLKTLNSYTGCSLLAFLLHPGRSQRVGELPRARAMPGSASTPLFGRPAAV